MAPKTIKLLDPSHRVLATGKVADEGTFFGGSLDLQKLPTKIRELFEEFEEVVNGQMLSFLDDVQARIGSLNLRVSFDDGTEVPVQGLQIYPSTGDVSFKLVDLTANGPAGTSKRGRN